MVHGPVTILVVPCRLTAVKNGGAWEVLRVSHLFQHRGDKGECCWTRTRVKHHSAGPLKLARCIPTANTYGVISPSAVKKQTLSRTKTPCKSSSAGVTPV